MPPGGKFAVISGDPLEAGPFVMRVRLPPGYMLPPYRRPNEEQLIVLAGAITVERAASPGRQRAYTDFGFVRVSAGERAAFCAHAGRRHRADRRHRPVRETHMSQHTELSYVTAAARSRCSAKRSAPASIASWSASASAKRWSSGTRTCAGPIASCSGAPTTLPSALLRLGLNPGERIGIWSQNNAEWLLVAAGNRQGGADPGQHQSGLSRQRAAIRLEQGAVPGADRFAVLQVEQLPGNAAGARAGTRALQAGKAGGGRASVALAA